MTSVAVLGAGKMGEALLAGLLEAGHRPGALCFTEKLDARAAEVTGRLGIRRVEIVEAAASDVLVVAVKPQDIEPVLGELAKAMAATARPDTVVVSLCAGLPTGLFEARLPGGTPVVRVMPNTPMVLGAAMSVLSPGRYATEEQLVEVQRLLEAVGRVLRVPEAQQDAVTALSGTGPAYFFYLAEALIEAGVLVGLARPVATELVVQSALGAARMLRESPGPAGHPVVLREAVTSPAGTTAAAVRELEAGGVRMAVMAAVEAARDRSVALGQALPSPQN